MNIRQFEYILAVAKHRHFELAAEKCFITQSTLSTMISRFEKEMGIQVFDRKKKPIGLTAEGKMVIAQLKKIVWEIEHLEELTQEIKGEVKGALSMAVIPTIAPFLLPRFLQAFAGKFPDLQIQVREQTTEEIIRNIRRRELDIGILSIPVEDKDLIEVELYDEPFVFYDAAEVVKPELAIDQLDVTNLCLLEEGHCMRTQIINLCDMHKKQLHQMLNFEYKAGSIDSLMRFVKANQATTLLPHLATVEMSPEEMHHVRTFLDPVPYRTVGLVVHRHFVKKKLLGRLKESIINAIEPHLPEITIKGQQLDPI